MLFLSLNMKIIFSVAVQELLACFPGFLLISKSFFGGVWTRNIFALNALPGAQYHKARWQPSFFFCFSPSLPPIFVVSPYDGEYTVTYPELLYALLFSTF